MNHEVSQAIEQHGAGKVGVYLVSFDEVVPILIQAHNHPVLDSVKWYVSDGSALNEAITKNIEAARFAVETNFLKPLAGGGEGPTRMKRFNFWTIRLSRR